MDIDFNKIKEDQIAQLTKIKDMLKEKLQGVKEENTRLQSEVIALKQGGAAPAAGSAGVGDMMGKLDNLFGLIIDKLDKILFAVNKPPSIKGTPVIQTGAIQQAAQIKSVEELASNIRSPSEMMKNPQLIAQQLVMKQPLVQQPIVQQPVLQQQPVQAQPATPAPAPEPTFQPRRPSDVFKAQQGQAAAPQPAPVQPAPVQPAYVQPAPVQPVVPQATEYEGGTGQIGATPAVIPQVGGKGMVLPYPADGVIRCPKCSKQDFQEMPDKSKRPQYGIYPKIYYCKQCRTEWSFDLG